MIRGIEIYVIAILFIGCISTNDVNRLSIDKRKLYPIGINDKWGFVNSVGETVILPIYDTVQFFSYGVALVKIGGKYGYLKKDGNWHIKPKYDFGSSFNWYCAKVAIKRDTFRINQKGRRIDYGGAYLNGYNGCNISLPMDPSEYFTKIDGKFELVYKYYLNSDSSKYLVQFDTTDLRIVDVYEFGGDHILVKKDGKYGLFDVWSHTKG